MRVDGIDLSYAVVMGGAYPRIDLFGEFAMPLFDAANDVCILEKYAINQADQTAVDILRNIIADQIVLWYMHDGTYMSAYSWMADEDYDPGMQAVEIDISANILDGASFVVDLDTDLDTYLYLYRLYIIYQGVEYASDYVAGVKDIQSFTVEQRVVSTISTGSGTLRRNGTDGRIYTKGLYLSSANPRFRGPLEHDKIRASWAARENAAALLDSWFDRAQAALDDIVTDLATLSGTTREYHVERPS